MGFHIPSQAEIQQVALSCGQESLAPGLCKGRAGDWPMQERGGDLCFDVSGNRRTGTMTNMDPATDRVETEMGRALDFGGTDYVVVPDSDHLDGMDQLTVSIWAKRTASNVVKGLFSKRESPQNSWYLYWVNDSFGWRVYNAAADASISTAIGSAVLNQWHHVCGVYDGTQISLYMDGVSAATPAVLTGAVRATSARVAIGDYFTLGTYGMTGQATLALIHSRALLLPEIQDLYARPHAMHTLRSRVFPAAVAPAAGSLLTRIQTEGLYVGSAT